MGRLLRRPPPEGLSIPLEKYGFARVQMPWVKRWRGLPKEKHLVYKEMVYLRVRQKEAPIGDANLVGVG